MTTGAPTKTRRTRGQADKDREALDRISGRLTAVRRYEGTRDEIEAQLAQADSVVLQEVVAIVRDVR